MVLLAEAEPVFIETGIDDEDFKVTPGTTRSSDHRTHAVADTEQPIESDRGKLHVRMNHKRWETCCEEYPNQLVVIAPTTSMSRSTGRKIRLSALHRPAPHLFDRTVTD